jgi:hypothetical protein
MVLRERALALGGFPAGSYCGGEDLALWMRLAVDAPIAVSDFIGCHYRRGIDSLTSSPPHRNAPDISMITLQGILEQQKDWPQARRAAVREYHSRLALAHCIDCLRTNNSEQAQMYLRLAAGTCTQHRRLWQARILCRLPRAVQAAVFLLIALTRH